MPFFLPFFHQVRQPNLAKIYPIHVSKASLPRKTTAQLTDIIQDHLSPTSKLLKCHVRICGSPCHLDGSPKCHGNAKGASCVNDAEAVAFFVSVADGSMWVTFLSQKWRLLALTWDLWHMLSQSSASRIGEVCFLFVSDLCMFMLFSERLAHVSSKHKGLSRTLPTLLENILRYMFRAWAIDITGQVEWDSFAQLGFVAF